MDESITKITENTITTEYLNSKHIDCSSLSGNVISGKYIEIRGRVEVKTDSMTTTMIALQPSKLDAFTSLGGLLVSQSSHPWCYPSGAFSYPYEGDIYDSIKLATNVEVHLIRPNYISCRYAMDTTDLHVTRNLQVNYCSTNTLHIQNFNSEPTKIGSSHAGGVNLYCDGFDLYIIKSDTNISQIEYTDAYASNFREMSSKLLKTNISEITDDDAKAFLQLSPVEFDFVEQFGGEHSVGILAEDLLELIPNCPAVHIPKNYDSTKKLKDIDFTSMDDIGSLLSVDYSNLVPYLMKVNQMQQKEIEALKSEIAEIKSMLVSLTN